MNRSRQMAYNAVAWRKIRVVVLERDGRLCQIRGVSCTLEATEVDHIIRPEDGGGWYDEANLRAACRSCNQSRGGRMGGVRTSARWARNRWKPSREW